MASPELAIRPAGPHRCSHGHERGHLNAFGPHNDLFDAALATLRRGEGSLGLRGSPTASGNSYTPCLLGAVTKAKASYELMCRGSGDGDCRPPALADESGRIRVHRRILACWVQTSSCTCGGAISHSLNTSFDVELSLSGKTITVNPGQSILDAVTSSGVQVLSSCNEGSAVLAGMASTRSTPSVPCARAPSAYSWQWAATFSPPPPTPTSPQEPYATAP